MKGISLFSSMGIGEYYLHALGIQFVLANEVDSVRANTYKLLYPETNVICGDLTKKEVRAQIVEKSIKENVSFLLATPPCQGFSLAGANKTDGALETDGRNHLVMHVLSIFNKIKPSHCLIENVPRFMNMKFTYKKSKSSLLDILRARYGKYYEVDAQLLNAADFGVPQTRYRAVFRLWKKGTKWELPKQSRRITLKECIGDLPSLEAGNSSSIKNHWARKHPQNQVEWMRHTPTGRSAFSNDIYFPQKKDGIRIKGYKNCYARMKWDAPAPTVTMRNEIISSQENVHPGRINKDGTWSDARVLTLRELLCISSLPPEMDVPSTLSEVEFRHLIGEGVPPLMLKSVIQGII